MKPITTKLVKFAVPLVMVSSLTTTVQAGSPGDTKELKQVREQYIKAVHANSPKAVSKLVADDVVMLQPNKVGPDTYGKKAFTEYRSSLNPVVSFTLEPKRIYSCGEWALEMGEEYTDWKGPQMDYSTMARYVKLLNREDDGSWKYARIFRAWDANSIVPPPATDKLSQSGWGSWEPRPVPARFARQGEEVTKTMDARGMVAGGDMVNPMADVVADDKMEGVVGLGYGDSWVMTGGAEEYMESRGYAAFELTEELRKIHEEVIVCDETTAFNWGLDVYSGVEKVTGKRSTGVGDYFYMVKKQKGKWKLGPFATLWSE